MQFCKKVIKRNFAIKAINKYRISYREAKHAEKNRNEQLKTIEAFGEKHPNDIICVIHRENEKTGLFSDIIVFLGRLKEAVDNGWIPVIDMKNYPNMYGCGFELPYDKNVWEFFFEQPMNISVEEAFASQKVIRVEANGAADYPFAAKGFLEDEYGKLTNWRKYVHKYIRLNKDIQEKVKCEYESLFKENEKVLGVLVRGSDYTKMRPEGHPIQPTVEQVIDKVKMIMEELNYDKIYLSTEEKETVERFDMAFQNKVVYLNRKYIEYSDGYLADMKLDVAQKINNGIEYLIQIVLLSRCNGIVAGICSGTIGAALLSEGFEYEYYWDLGYY